MPNITVDYFGFSGTGRTVKDAKLDAGRKIAKLQEGYWTPALREWRGYGIVIYRTLNGWEYAYIAHPGEPLKLSGCCCLYADDQREAVSAAERAIADNGWNGTAEDLDSFPDFLADPRARADIRSRRVWALRIRHFMAQGIDQNTAFDLANYRTELPPGITEWKEPTPCTNAT